MRDPDPHDTSPAAARINCVETQDLPSIQAVQEEQTGDSVFVQAAGKI
jgi:hypothetical protein